MITHVAIKYDGKVYSLPNPYRHHDVIRLIGGIAGPDIQGFLTSSGEFLNRRQAYTYAQEHNQLKRRPGGYNGNQLFSEDLW